MMQLPLCHFPGMQATPVQSEAVIPEGRKLVRVVLLNGRSVDFTVEVCTRKPICSL